MTGVPDGEWRLQRLMIEEAKDYFAKRAEEIASKAFYRRLVAWGMSRAYTGRD